MRGRGVQIQNVIFTIFLAISEHLENILIFIVMGGREVQISKSHFDTVVPGGENSKFIF